jgi:hypothetical protein
LQTWCQHKRALGSQLSPTLAGPEDLRPFLTGYFLVRAVTEPPANQGKAMLETFFGDPRGTLIRWD